MQGRSNAFPLRTENVIWATSCCSRLISGLLLRQNIAVHPWILLCALCVVLQPFRQQIDKSLAIYIHHHRRIRLIPRQEIIIHHRHPLGVFPLGFHANPTLNGGENLRFQQPSDGARVVQRRADKSPFFVFVVLHKKSSSSATIVEIGLPMSRKRSISAA